MYHSVTGTIKQSSNQTNPREQLKSSTIVLKLVHSLLLPQGTSHTHTCLVLFLVHLRIDGRHCEETESCITVARLLFAQSMKMQLSVAEICSQQTRFRPTGAFIQHRNRSPSSLYVDQQQVLEIIWRLQPSSRQESFTFSCGMEFGSHQNTLVGFRLNASVLKNPFNVSLWTRQTTIQSCEVDTSRQTIHFALHRSS